MKGNLISETSVSIKASAARVWKAITDPQSIKQYLFGTKVTSDFKEGSEITYEGEFEGKSYKDKGVIRKMEPGKIFQSTFLSGAKEDKPENYNLVTFRLVEEEGKTVVTLSQDNIASEKEKEHSDGNWSAVLKKLKEVVEAEG
ncbi:SRPBCC family protein [Chitinophaga niabensis]|uniref:Uncharacterized conserved protein YndB, AHSA1/START domain n=1 Tax=Chitinophaga niabensis TaxID=536979 RepID=A0A1N6G6E4_9BACT|nr:SRPBCC family protein [Chitinophaga niabensis]SIO03031.1 Uncharacterized conserved protein YndB, AHSA1/START domain [Chitinophaga niabensis]